LLLCTGGVLMDEESGANKLRRIVNWCDMQEEWYFDDHDMDYVLKLFEACMDADVDMIEDIPNEILAKHGVVIE